jgi:hypothetical protein
MTPDQAFIQWALGQGVAVVILVWVLARVDNRLLALQSSVDQLLAYLRGKANGQGPTK